MKQFKGLTAVLFLTLASCESLSKQRMIASKNESESPKFSEIENGLLPAVLVKGQPLKPWNLRERMEHYKVPGISMALINNGQIEWVRTYGVSDKKSGSPVTNETRFQAASISKTVAALGVLTLVQKAL